SDSSPPIGRPVRFSTGPMAGIALRAELDELQKANLGRRFAWKDKRTLDPPPVVRLRLFEVNEVDAYRRREQEIRGDLETKCHGFVCQADLFPIPEEYYVQSAQTESLGASTKSGTSTAEIQRVIPVMSPSNQRLCPHRAVTRFTSEWGSGPSHAPRKPASRPRGAATAPAATATLAHTDVVAHLGQHTITECSSCTPTLAGAKFVSPSCIDYKGSSTLIFVYSDLAVRMTGTFILRYRVFNVLSVPADMSMLPVLAECYGGCFKVYSTKDFPGLPPSTELTKYISLFGVRLNSREHERKRRKKASPSSDAKPSSRIATSSSRTVPSSPPSPACSDSCELSDVD
ncbi:uncharacterized protein LAESUDRAFT_638635, partial [Laetiporus sulphureus 93-53]